MITSDTKPKLKQQVEILPAKENDKDREFLILRDTEGLTNQTLVLPIESIVILQFLNGNNSIKDIQNTFLRLTNQIIPETDIIDFIKQLDDAGFIENEKTQEKRKKLFEEFKNSNIRPSIHKGLSYPDNILELTSFLSKFLKTDISSLPVLRVTGLISPHIDIIRGGTVYADGYGELLKAIIPDIIIAFGVSHKGGNSPFIFTKKSYETPYGNMDVDLDLYNKFKSILWYEADGEEYYHKQEHSLEFQALWLKYIWREKAPKWIPILVSDFERFTGNSSPSKIEYIEKFFKEADGILKSVSLSKKVMILCGVDLSHVGPRFGDDIEITPQLKLEIENLDRELIEDINNLRYEDFYLKVVSNENATNICGLSAIYSGLRFISSINPQLKGKLLGYKQADDPFGGFVSFASIVF